MFTWFAVAADLVRAVLAPVAVFTRAIVLVLVLGV